MGIGASAGGLEAFIKLLKTLPGGLGLALVLIQHLEPTHNSMLVDLLTDHTSMRVIQAADGMPVEPDYVYAIPPRAFLSIRDGVFRLSAPREGCRVRMPVDFFLRSLAQECGGRATCVILSGTGSDGSAGLKAVKDKGGLVIVQDPEEAEYDGMPRSAVATGLAEFVLRVERISEVIIQHSRQSSSGHHPGQSTLRVGERDGLTGIIELLRMRTPHNFALYKRGTLRRRIERRMTISAIDDFNAYLELLRGDARELGDLAKDLLIHVTSFFRDDEVFALLGRTTVPELVHLSTGARTVRIWVPGCSTRARRSIPSPCSSRRRSLRQITM